MKRIILGISVFLVLTGCNTIHQNSIFIQECKKINPPFIDNSLSNIFENEKSLKIETQNIKSCVDTQVCYNITKSKRWENININLEGDNQIFPTKSGMFTFSRDYSLNNCISNFTKYRKNIFDDKDGIRQFCIRENNENINYRIKYIKNQNDIYNSKGTVITKSINTVLVDDKIYLKNEDITANYPTGQDFCGMNNEIYKKIWKNF